MAEEKKINGHRPKGLAPLVLAADPSGPHFEADFDVDATLQAVVRLHSEIPADGYTAPMLGTQREGHGIVIGDDGLILTVGYLVMEAMAVSVSDAHDQTVPAEVIAYDYDSGFGLVRATRDLGIKPMPIGVSATARINDPVLVAGHGGREDSHGAFIVDRREFAGYWEYLLENAIFTSPPTENWGGSALIGSDGRLIGVGSLYVEDARPAPHNLPGNMFIPIDRLKPILSELLSKGRTEASRRPWLGMLTSEVEDRLEVVGVSADGPAARAGLKPGDAVIKVGNDVAHSLAGMYRLIWALGGPGTAVPLTILRGAIALHLTVQSEDRYARLKFGRPR